jgi:hypothetical protein
MACAPASRVWDRYHQGVTLTTPERAAYLSLARAGALSVKALDHDHPRVEGRSAWDGLLVHGLARLYHTIYGPVVGLTPAGRQQAQGQVPHVPYLMGPGSVVNRAYLVDALRLLKTLGYEESWEPPQYRRYPHRTAGRPYTDEIVSRTVRIPDAAYAAVGYFRHGPPHSLLSTMYHRPGLPRLYASIANGGITPKQGELYLRRHALAIRCWQTPLLLAVPDPAPFESLLARQHRYVELIRHPALQLIVVPLQRTTLRPLAKSAGG